VRVAAESGCDMIVLGSHGLSGIASVLLGSVAMKVVQQTKVPVLLVR
jgi:nucleotide-binding universal stress UspA family protein